MNRLALEDKVAIITGGGRGIGAATAKIFAREGAKIVIAGRNAEELKSTSTDLGDGVTWIRADVSSSESVRALFAFAIKKWGKVDVLVNNAGIAFIHEKFSDHSEEDWDQVMAVNLKGTFLCCREAFAKMKPGGVIVNISSLAGFPGVEKFKGTTAYSVSKFGVSGLTESLAIEASDCGLRINAIAPGAVNTKTLHSHLPHLKTNAEPADIAEIILSICEDRSSKLNGAIIPIYTKAWTE